MNKDTLGFFEFIYDRQAVHYVRSAHKPRLNWTRDPVLRDFKFCNVRRRDDACTQHLIRRVIENPNLSKADVVMNIVLFRFFNTRDFFDVVHAPVKKSRWDFKSLEKALDKRKAAGHSLYNLAYRICSACVDKKYRPRDKHVQLLFAIEKMTFVPKFDEILKIRSIKQFTEEIRYVPFVGSFLAYQIALDVHYHTPFHDAHLFVDVGPGAIEGVQFIFGKNVDVVAGCKDLFHEQQEYFEDLRAARGKDWAALTRLCGWKSPEIALSDIENCLCEYRKYYKLKNGITTRIRRFQHVLR